MNARALSADVLLGIAPIACVIALWQGLVSFGYAPVSLLPPPGLVFARLAQQLVSSGFLYEIGVTLFRLFVGFSIAVALGVGLGLAAAVSPTVNAVVKPVVRVLAPVPKVALYPAASITPRRSRWSRRMRCFRSCCRPGTARAWSSRS